MPNQSSAGGARPADSADVRKILGNLDTAKVTDILALKPSLADLQNVATCMAGDHDVVAKSGHHVPVIAAQIIELLMEAEEESEK